AAGVKSRRISAPLPLFIDRPKADRPTAAGLAPGMRQPGRLACLCPCPVDLGLHPHCGYISPIPPYSPGAILPGRATRPPGPRGGGRAPERRSEAELTPLYTGPL